MVLDTRIKDLASAVRDKSNSLVTAIGLKVASVSGTAPIVSSGGTTPTLSITPATASAAGSMSAADKAKLDGLSSGTTYTAGSGISITGNTIAADNTVARLASPTFTGLVKTPASTSSVAGLNIGQGEYPGTVNAGDLWVTSGGFYVGIGSGIYQLATLSGNTFAYKQTFNATLASQAAINLVPGSAPSGLTNGDVWTTSTALNVRLNGATQTVAFLASPTLTGTPAAPTANAGTSTTQLATTAFVSTAITNANILVRGVIFSVIGTASASEQVSLYPIVYAGSLTATGGFVRSLVAATASTTLTIKRYASGSTTATTIGTIVFAAGASTGTINITTPTVAVGDSVTIEGPSTADTTLAGVNGVVRIV